MAGQELAVIVKGRIAELRDPAFEQQVALAIPEGMSPQKLLRAAATAVLENPELARDDLRESLIRATLKTAQDGLLPDGREAAFVIFEGNNPSVAYMPMVQGLRKIAAEFGWSLFSAIVYENDTFDPDFETMKANHRPTRLGQDRGAILGAYATAQHKDGRRMLEVMDKAEIDKVRKVSRASSRGPWVDWYEQMARIRPERRLIKRLPMDPKDAERVERILAAADLTEDAATLLYGSEDRQAGSGVSSSRARDAEPVRGEELESASPPPSSDEPHEPIPDEADIGPDADDLPFEGEEPVEGEIVDADAPTFTAGKHKDRTIAEVFALGDEGVTYLKWALRSWKTDPLASALVAFAETHPEIKP